MNFIWQQVLELDVKNCAAYIFLGAAHQDDQPERAAKFLKQAIPLTDDPTIVYLGLLKCVSQEEVPEICKKVLQYAPDKYATVYERLETASLLTKNQNICIDIIANDLKHTTDEAKIVACYASLLNILTGLSSIPEHFASLYCETLEYSLKLPNVQNFVKLFRKYLKCLYNQKKYKLAVAQCLELLSLHPKEEIALEIICKVYIDTFQQNDFDFSALCDEGIAGIVEKLLNISSTSPFGLLAKGLYLFRNGNLAEARDTLNNAKNVSKTNTLCLKTLAITNFKLGAYSLAEYYYAFINCVNVESVASLVEQRDQKKCLQALTQANQLTNLTDTEQFDLDEAVAKANLVFGSAKTAQEIIDRLVNKNQLERANRLIAIRYKLENNNEKALEILQRESFQTTGFYLLLAQCYFDADNINDALSYALMATKLEPYNSNCYFWLGQIYTRLGDSERSRKCFEKSVFLNPQHEQSVILLSTIYRQLSNWDLNLNLLQKAAQAIPNRSCKWATLQLGFHNLSQNEFEEAISAFRTCLRLDPNDLLSWHGLADSYLKRGSYSSALKIYKKICELTENNKFYPRLQVANIKSTLRYYNEAIICYEELLLEEPNSVPTLKGLAETHLCLAHQYFDSRWLGKSKYHTTEAVKHLIVAIQIRSNFICLWRLLGNTFDLAACFPMAEAELSVPGSLANESVDVITLKGEQLYEFAAKFYARTLKINPADELIWYELALNYYSRAVRYANPSTKKKHLELATEATKHAIKLSPNRWRNWNLLGVICTIEEVKNERLAQHCFIKSLELDKKLAVVWTNLGVLYLSNGVRNASLANAAFSQAQQSEPSYSVAWTGQALIAELVNSIEKIDLLKHSLSLAYGDEAALRYSHWVCTFLSDTTISDSLQSKADENRLRYAIENMHAIPTALDSMTWYCRSKGDEVSAEALTFLGFLYLKQQHWKNAIKAFNGALDKTESKEDRDRLLCNVAYCYLKNDEPLEAVRAFSSVSDATYHSSMGLALAHFKAKQYENSYETYQNTLEYLAQSDLEKSLALIAIASMVYVFQGENDAKSVLFQCIGLPEPPVEALLSACSLGLLHNDLPLAQLVLKELNKYEKNPKWCHHLAFLRVQLYVKTNDPKQALLYLQSMIYKYPNLPELRKLFAIFVLQNCKKTEQHLKNATQMLEGTIILQDRNNITSLDISKLFALASEASRLVNEKMSSKFAQKAVHINPCCKEAWAAQAAKQY